MVGPSAPSGASHKFSEIPPRAGAVGKSTRAEIPTPGLLGGKDLWCMAVGDCILLTPARGAPYGPGRKPPVVLAVASCRHQIKRRPQGAGYGSGRVPAHIPSRHSQLDTAPTRATAAPGPAPATPSTPSGGPASWPRWLATPWAPPRPRGGENRAGERVPQGYLSWTPRATGPAGQRTKRTFSCQLGRDAGPPSWHT